MRQPIASKLAELRAQVVEIQARKSFTPAQRKAVYEAQEGLCAACEEPLAGKFEIDHVISLGIGGKHEPGNWLGKCRACHVAKTAIDRKVQAKAARIVRRETEGQSASRLQSRGFDKSRTRGFDGKVRERSA